MLIGYYCKAGEGMTYSKLKKIIEEQKINKLLKEVRRVNKGEIK